MRKRMKSVVATLCATAMMAVVAASPAAAQQNQSGLVNVAIGDVTIQDINVGVAALIVANVCPNVEVNAAILAEQVVRGGQNKIVCTVGDNQIRVFQD